VQRFDSYRLVPCWGFVVAAALFGCGDDAADDGATGFSDDTTCGATLALSGALELRVPPSRTNVACATQTSFDSGIDAGFLFVDSELSHADLEVDDVLEGETGTAFAARLTIVHEDGREWSAQSCTAEIIEHEHVGPGDLGWERYRVVGSVSCEAAPSDPPGTAPEVDVESFLFVATISWG